jgi:hypothetical protein
VGGAIGSALCAVAALVLYGTGYPVLFSIAIVNAVIELASWRLMRYFAKTLARNRLFAQKVLSGELEMRSEEAHQYWEHLRESVTMDDVNTRDVRDLPNWITTVNMAAFVIGIILLVAGAIIRLTQ